MAKNILVISCDFRETRAALIEDGVIAELHVERKGRQSSTVGNVYLGKVTRVLPGLQAAFIDIGQERAAFLHVEDLIRPDDFDEYLAGGRKVARGKEDGTRTAIEVDEDEAEDGEGVGEAEAGASAAVAGEAAMLDAPSVRDVEEDIVDEADDDASDDDDESDDDASDDSDDDDAPATKEAASLVDVSADDDDSDDDALDTEADESEEVAFDDAEATSDLPPVPVRREAGDLESDLERTVSYPNWPEPPSRDSSPPRTSRNGAASVARALAAELAGEIPVAVAPAAESSAGDLLVRGALNEVDDAAPLPPPTRDVLLDPEEDEADSEGSARAPSSDEDDDDLADMPGFTVTDPGEPVPRAPAPARTDDRSGARGRRRRGRGRGAERGSDGRREAKSDGARARADRGGRERRGGRSSGQGMPGRISKTTPIREVVREGQEIIVQVTKDPIGTKGARCSSHISLPGRYVVYLPTVDHIGISKRIGSDKERARLREAIEAMKPPSGGLIVRTVAEGLTKKGLKQDVGYLVRLWGDIAKKREGARSPAVLSSELDLVLKVARDLFTDDVDEVVIDDKQQYERLCRFVEMFAPDRVKDVKFYDEDELIFDEYGIEDEIRRALSRKVPLPSGGYLIIDQAEALTAIDVNTGRFVGKGSKDMEETILKTNLEAVHEIAYQLRFRNIGGLIILDLIDMESHKNREKVRRSLEELLQKDKAKTTLNRISELGLIEMTRKRTRESLGRLMNEPCFYCDGTGHLHSKETVAYEILRELRRKKSTLPGYSVVINAHPAVADVLMSTEKASVQDAENRYMRKIVVTPRKEYHLQQFDLVGK